MKPRLLMSYNNTEDSGGKKYSKHSKYVVKAKAGEVYKALTPVAPPLIADGTNSGV